ncbi:MAG: peptidylprolyl isomerase [bacterium]|jgi:peptidyl-prolyl cis-trans isomerase SurA|nr:peptidylprolyl isomerase [candidate division KSB1 bacterium]MDH7561188.1 peptidylprolyl isomerase [bacterium]
MSRIAQAALIVLVAAHAALAQEVLDRVVAVVDDKPILESEVSQGAFFLAMQLRIDPNREPERFKELQRLTLETLVTQQILLEKAEEDTVVADAKRVEAFLEQQMQSIIQQLGSQEKVEEYFGMPMRKIRRQYEEEIRKNLTVQQLRETKFGNVKVSRREVEQFYAAHKDSLPGVKEAVEISHILVEVRPGEEARQNALRRMEEVKRRLAAGEDFAQVAREMSDDPGSAQRGGDLGFMQRGDFVREFEEVAFSLEPGQRSEVVETQFGFHLIELLDRRGEKVRVRHILIALGTTKEDEKAAAERIKDVYRQLREGGDFAALAKELSDDETTAQQGGHLGWFELDQLRETAPEFVVALRGLAPGQITEPFRTKYGFHILKLLDRRQPRVLTLETDWDTIEQMALNDKKQREFEKWVAELRAEMYVEVKGL